MRSGCRGFGPRLVPHTAVRPAALAALIVTLAWANVPRGGAAAQSASLPASLAAREFWALSEALSEPAGHFPSDNLVSNESTFQRVLPDLLARVGTGGVYLGVGPEQNFTYIAALEPQVAFVLDVRAGNRDLHLLYKALFALADSRADFVARLFSRARPRVDETATATELMAAVHAQPASEADQARHIDAVRDVLLRRWRLPLSSDVVLGIESVHRQFFRFGPGITYSSSRFLRVGTGTTYAVLMTATDTAGVPRSFLASEDHYRVVKRLQESHLVVPVVGDFAGPTALRAIGSWLRDRGARVSAFYLSNVEDYLSRDGVWMDFCRNAAALPLAPAAAAIRSGRGYQDPDPLLARGRRSFGSTSQFQRMAQPSLGDLPIVRLGVLADDLTRCRAAAP